MMKIIATDGKSIVATSLKKLPQELMIFDNLDKVSYKIVGQEEITEKELQGLFDKFLVPCVLV